MKKRIAAAAVFLAILGLFVFLWFAADGRIDFYKLFGPCGFKQEYDLPCPTCGMTTSMVAFVRGRIFKSFYIQPATGLFCSLLAITAGFAFLKSVFGFEFAFLNRIFERFRMGYLIIAIVIIILCGWAVTLARMLAEN